MFIKGLYSSLLLGVPSAQGPSACPGQQAIWRWFTLMNEDQRKQLQINYFLCPFSFLLEWLNYDPGRIRRRSNDSPSFCIAWAILLLSKATLLWVQLLLYFLGNAKYDVTVFWETDHVYHSILYSPEESKIIMKGKVYFSTFTLSTLYT